MIIPDKIHALIFDLGGVILDLSVKKTMKAFSTISGKKIAEIEAIYVEHPSFDRYERGLIDDKKFRDELRGLLNDSATDEDLENAWNAMLVDLPAKKLELLERLKDEFDVYLLSNTNALHINHIEENMLKDGSLDDYVHRAYYSHELNMRKPESDIFNHVLKDANLHAENALFLDDNLENVKAARAMGFHTLHITRPDMIYDIFKDHNG